MSLVDPIAGAAVDRAAWSLAYFGRTLYFNGPGAALSAKAFLRDEDEVADREMIRDSLARGIDPIGALLDRVIRVCYRRLGAAGRAAKRRRWEFAEPTLNARCRLAVALLEPRDVAAMLRRLLPAGCRERSARLAGIDPELDDKRRIGTPDLLIAGPGSTFLLEMKVRGLPSRHMYDLKQLVQYVNLGADQRRAAGRGHRTVHVLMRPEGGGAICSRRREWFPDAVAGRAIRFDAAAVRRAARRYKWRPALDHRTALGELPRVPVFERTYRQLLDAVPARARTSEYGRIALDQLAMLVANAEPQRSRA